MIVPTNERSVFTDVTPQPRQTAAAFGAVQAQQIGQMAQVGMELGREISTTKARERLNSILPQLDNDFNEFRTAKRGTDATPDAFGEYNEYYNNKINEVTKDLSPYASELVRSDLDSKRVSYQMQWNDHSAKEIKTAKDNSFALENSRLAREVAAGKTVDENGLPLRSLIEANNRQVAPGQSPEFYTQKAKEMVGEAAVNQINSLAYADPEAGIAMLNRHREDIDPKVYAELQKKLAESALQKHEDSLAAEVAIGAMPIDKAEKEAEKKALSFDEMWERDAFGITVQAKQDEVKAVELQTHAQSTVNALQPLLDAAKTGDIATIGAYVPPADADALSAKTALRLRNALIAKSVGKGVNQRASQSFEVDLAQMNQEDFINQDPNDWIGKLDTSRFNHWLDKWTKSRKGDDTVRLTDSKVNDAVRSALVSSGNNDPKSSEIAAVRFLLQDHIDAAEKDGKPVDQNYVFRIASQYAIDKAYKKNEFNKALSSGDVYEMRASIAEDLTNMGMKADSNNIKKIEDAYKKGKLSLEIPEDSKAAISEALRRQGLTPTPNKIRAAWIQSQVKF